MTKAGVHDVGFFFLVRLVFFPSAPKCCHNPMVGDTVSTYGPRDKRICAANSVGISTTSIALRDTSHLHRSGLKYPK